jgi:cupin fold WbuC family metalloprotein
MASRRALDPPPGELVVLGEELAQRALAASRESDRKRVILPFHKSHEDPLHRMLNAAQPGTYVRPHRHLSTPRAEVFLVLRGAVTTIVFYEDGTPRLVQTLEAGSAEFGIDIAPGLFHTFVVRAPDTLLYEVKLGPYLAASAKDFAPWAPEESAPEAPAYLRNLEQLAGA